MGIFKIVQKGGGSFCKESSSSVGKDKKRGKRSVRSVELEDSSDDCELAEVNCEFGLVEGQLCNIPYELYDLPNLRDILSLETWNSCLTEEERFYLSAYIPDMNQQTFWLTMKELLGGSDMYFGSPLDTFFERLKGGYYPPKVTSFRECLHSLQRRKHYHSLRSYNDNMTGMFKEMSKLWSQCDMNVGIEGRLYKWRTRQLKRSNSLLDLNTIPEDGDLLCEWTNSDAARHYLSRRVNPLGNKIANNTLPLLSAGGMKFVSPNCGTKGVLKLRAPSNSSTQNPNLKMTSSGRSEPKGLLKVGPKVTPIGFEHSKAVLRQPQLTSLGSNKGLVDHRISSLPVSLLLRDRCGPGESPIVQQKIGETELQTTLGLSNCVLNRQESPVRASRFSEGSSRKILIKRGISPSSDYIADLGGRKLFRTSNVEYESSVDQIDAMRSDVGAKAWWQNLSLGSGDVSVIPTTQFPLKDLSYKRNHSYVHQTNLARISDFDVGKQEPQLASSSLQMKGQTDADVKDHDKLSGNSSVPNGFKDDLVLPLTYKRRKATAKQKTFEYAKPLTIGADLNSACSK